MTHIPIDAPVIAKTPPRPGAVTPYLTDWEAARAAFRWEAVRQELAGPWGGVNMAWAALDRHVAAGEGDRTALRWRGRDGRCVDMTYAELAGAAHRFADGLHRLGVGPGDTVFTLLGRVPETMIAALGTLAAGCVYGPLFAAFGPDPVRLRLGLGRARVLVTTAALLKRKGLERIAEDVTGLSRILVTDAPGDGMLSFAAVVDGGDPATAVAPTAEDDPALLHFTSGTTGQPKGALHAHGAILGQYATARLALDLHPGEVYWCTADSGWVTGTVYGILAPLAAGATVVVDEGDFDAERWYRLIERERVAIWYTTPTAIRLLMRAGEALPRGFDLSSLRHLACVGEPLNPEAVTWSANVLGRPFHDTWWQTETGAIMLANYAALDVVPGMLGRPVPGVDVAIVSRQGDRVEAVEEEGTVGELALRPNFPSLFRGYVGDEERTRRCFAGDWYLSGDLAERDGTGAFRFVGRSGDVIKTSGHLVGPFEVESVLLEHPAVAEAGVIGKPDPVAGEIIKAFLALKPGFAPGEDLSTGILAHARRRLGPALAPREIAFARTLPHTRSGKIMRRLLKARELGLPEGDLSTLEDERPIQE